MGSSMMWFENKPQGQGIFYVENLMTIRCKICTKVNNKKKLLVPKWDSLEKHVQGKGRMNKE